MVSIKELRFDVAVAFRKGFGWQSHINSAVRENMNTGAYDLINKNYIAKGSNCKATPAYFPLGLKQFQGLFVYLSTGILVSVNIAFVVWIFRRLQFRFGKKREYGLDVSEVKGNQANQGV